jgi:alpha-ribazole phosphatase
MVATLFLLRHGRTVLAGKMVGSTDVELAGDGIKQIHTLREMIHGEKFQRVFCSPMRRCKQTAEILDLEAEISYVDELREINFGRWEGLEFSDIESQEPQMIQNWMENPDEFCFPKGECRSDFILRIEEFKGRMLSLADKKILIITHGGVIRHLICLYLGLPVNNYLLFQVGEGLLTTLDCFGERGVLTGFNIGRGKKWEG